jgi:hypothetical protein
MRLDTYHLVFARGLMTLDDFQGICENDSLTRAVRFVPDRKPPETRAAAMHMVLPARR